MICESLFSSDSCGRGRGNWEKNVRVRSIRLISGLIYVFGGQSARSKPERVG